MAVKKAKTGILRDPSVEEAKNGLCNLRAGNKVITNVFPVQFIERTKEEAIVVYSNADLQKSGVGYVKCKIHGADRVFLFSPDKSSISRDLQDLQQMGAVCVSSLVQKRKEAEELRRKEIQAGWKAEAEKLKAEIEKKKEEVQVGLSSFATAFATAKEMPVKARR
jgi:hypothetical protein